MYSHAFTIYLFLPSKQVADQLEDREREPHNHQPPRQEKEYKNKLAKTCVEPPKGWEGLDIMHL
jgi:hypothetical protein